MTVQFDDARIKITVDTDAAKKTVQDIQKSHGDLRNDRDEDSKNEKKKKRAGKKAARDGFLRRRITGGTARARSFLVRQAPYTGIPVVSLVAGAVVALQRYIAPLVASAVADSLKEILPDFLAEDETIENMKRDILDTMDATIGEAVIQITSTLGTVQQTADFLKKVSLLAGEVPDIEDGWKFAKGTHGWNAHLKRMQHFGSRKMMEQYGKASTDLFDRIRGLAPQK